MLRDSKIKIIVDCWEVPVLIILALLIRFMPDGIVSSEIVQICKLPLKIITIMIAAFIAFKSFRLNGFYLVMFLYLFIKVFSTYLNNQDAITCIWNAVSCVSMMIILEWGMKRNYKSFINIISLYFVFMLFLNLCSVLLLPKADLAYIDYFLGYRNVFIVYGLPALLFTGIRRYEEDDSKPYLWILAWFILIATFVLLPSSTSIIGLLCLLLYVLLFNHRWSRKIMNMGVYCVGVALIFFFIVYQQQDGLLARLTTQIMGKDITFTNRTYIWRDYIRTIRRSLLMGFGIVQESDLYTVFSGTYSWATAHAHNIILNVLFQTGIIGFVLSVNMFISSSIKLNLMKNDKIRYFSEAVLGALLLMSQFEAYSQELYFLIFGFIYFYTDIRMKEVNENEKFMLA